MIGGALVVERSLARGGIDLHPAYRVGDFTSHDGLVQVQDAPLSSSFRAVR